MTDLQTIPLNRLVHSKSNVRKTGRDLGIEGLMVSISTHGLRQNLNVRPISGNRFEVVAGGRRLEAMRQLAKQGKMKPAAPVPCQILAEGDNATEVSLVENAMRTDMHPDDQCAAFDELVEGGMPIEDVAARFGVTPLVVRRRLRLARVSPKLRKLHREGEVSLAQMMALALVDDHAAQEKAWDGLPDYNRDPRSLRRHLTQEGLPSTHRLARFVTVEAYEEAGGLVLRDLFEDEQPPVLADAMLVERLAQEKLDYMKKLVLAEGWSWVITALEHSYEPFDRLPPDEDGSFASADMERGGAKITLGWDGTVDIERGLIEREVKPAASKTEKEDSSPAYSEAVLTDLAAHKSAALRLEMAQTPKTALAAVVHAMGLGPLYHTGMGTCLDLTGRSSNLGTRVQLLEECSAHAALDAVSEAWRESLPRNADEFWAWCLAAAPEKLMELLALLAGLTVDVTKDRASAGQLAASLSLDMQKHWTPKVDGFYSRLSKPLMVKLLTEAHLAEDAAKVAGLKKGEAAVVAATKLGGAGWLPEVLV